eukprot:scaffold492_cov347-Prasinococcus_capsulatus_cf.AAC.4
MPLTRRAAAGGWPQRRGTATGPRLRPTLEHMLVAVLLAAAVASGEEEGVVEECGAHAAAWGLGEAGAGASAAAATGVVLRRCSVAAVQERRGLLVLYHIPKTGGTTLHARAADVLRGVQRCPNPTYGLNNETAVEALACVVRAHQEHPGRKKEKEEFVIVVAKQPYYLHHEHGKKPPKDVHILCAECDFYSYELRWDGLELLRELRSRSGEGDGGGLLLPLTLLREPLAHVESQINHYIFYNHNTVPPEETLRLWNEHIFHANGSDQIMGYNPFNMQTRQLADWHGASPFWAEEGGAWPNVMETLSQEVTMPEFREEVMTRALESAKHNVRDTLFWFGITEHYDASVCLLQYQLDIFDATNCRCDSAADAVMVKPANHLQDKKGYKNVKDRYRHLIEPLVQADMELYGFAHELFVRRVRLAEREVGQRFLCEDV